MANLRLPRATEVAVHLNNTLPFQEGNQTKIPKGKKTYSTPGRFSKHGGGGGVAEPTNKIYCFLKVGANVGSVAVLHRDPLVV